MRSSTRKRTGKNPLYLKFIRSLKCFICEARPVEAAHVGMRGMSQKSADTEAIPLCRVHHQHGYPESHHTLGKRFWEHHKRDRDFAIRSYQALFEVWKEYEDVCR